MHPVLFEFQLFSKQITIHTYGFMIMLGAILGFAYMAWQSKKQFNLSFESSNYLFIILVISGVVGGKILYFFEDPVYFSSNMDELFGSRGFVFYGSLGLCIPAMLIFFRINKLPVLGMLDIMSFTTVIVHMFGRVGCFTAGCCHGIPWEGPLAVVFTDPACVAPLNTPLHPTQLYSVTLLLTILVTLVLVKRRQQFTGQLFMLYLMMYAVGRSIIEIYRGDESRGYLVEEQVSNSQFIAFIFLVVAGYIYYKLWKKRGKPVSGK